MSPKNQKTHASRSGGKSTTGKARVKPAGRAQQVARAEGMVRAKAASPTTLAPSRLLPADVLLYHGTGLISTAIRFFDGTDVSHASLLLAGGTSPSVGEALARGLARRPLATSVSDSAWVMARRLTARPPDVSPVLDRARYYLGQGERYAYEKIFLLAFLCLIRKPKITPIFKRMVIAVLERASQLLADLTSFGKRPMICSEFVYRCYEEGLKGSLDPFGFSVRRTATPEGIRAPGARHRADRVHPESVLAAVMTHYQDRKPATARAEALEREDYAPLLQRYLREVRQPNVESALVVETGDKDLEGAVSRFAARWRQPNAEAAGTESVEALARGPELASLYSTAADFVTPGDLYRNENLMTLGRLSQ